MTKRLLFPDFENSPLLMATKKDLCVNNIWFRGWYLTHRHIDSEYLEFQCDRLSSMNDYAMTDMGCPVISERFKILLESTAIYNVQYFPVRIIDRRGKAIQSAYYALNIVGLSDHVDFDVKDRDVDCSDKTYVASIFRVQLLRHLIVVDEPLISVLNDNNIKGLCLVEPKNWDGMLEQKQVKSFNDIHRRRYIS